MVTYYLIILDYSYICTCTKGGHTTLGCGDLLCLGCTEKLMYQQKFDEKNIDLFYEIDAKQIWTKVKIQCPKCLMISKISNSI